MANIDDARTRATAILRNKTTILVLGVFSVLVFFHFLLRGNGGHGHSLLPLESFRDSGTVLRRDSWPSRSDYDLVVAHYDEDLQMMRETVEAVLQHIPSSSTRRVIIYSKGDRSNAGLRELLEIADEVVAIPNVGREGETYLNHITRNWEEAATGLAEKTIFMQHHLRSRTGFMSFGPYLNQTCGVDSAGQEHPRMADIYSMFRGTFCPPIPALATWAGQFVVSKKRILDNDLSIYVNLRALFHAPEDHWIWKEGWWNNKPSNPTLGHALERAWPVIFDCTDPSIAKTCSEKSKYPTNCQCLD
ncbi:hypothetical protein IAT38_008465 [Cryptococcus sp. DSM 104549]